MVGLAALLVASVTLVGCGEERFDRAAAVDSFAAANPDATEGQSECVVDRLIERYSIDGLEIELTAEPPGEAFEEAQFRDMFACGLEGDIQGQITVQLEANDVAPSDAPCVADILVAELDDDGLDVLLSGQITDEFFADFVSAMEECGAINS